MWDLRTSAWRALRAVGTLVFVIAFNFFLFRTMGDPERDLARNPRLTEEAQRAIINERGLDQDQWTQFVHYVKDLSRGDLGTSFVSAEPVGEKLWQALPNTVVLVGGAALLAIVVGVWLGALAGWRQGTRFDTVTVQASLILQSVPAFWLGMLLIYVVAVKLGWLPTGLSATPGSTTTGLAAALDTLRHAVLPILTLGAGQIAQYVLIMRASVVNVTKDDFVTTARAVGMPEGRILRR